MDQRANLLSTIPQICPPQHTHSLVAKLHAPVTPVLSTACSDIRVPPLHVTVHVMAISWVTYIMALPIRALLGSSQDQGFRSRLVSPVSPGLSANCRLLVLTRPHKSQAVLGLLPIANY
jgi:hypothetical protein